AAGSYGERLSEDQPDEFGAIAHGLNLMTAALAWRERMQEYASHLLAALNAPSGEGGGLAQALTVVAAATGAAGMVLYQPDYDANTWAPTARRSLDAGIVPRPVMKEIVGDGREVMHYEGEAAVALRARFHLQGPAG